MLLVNNISSGYGKKQVLYNVTFSVSDGEILYISGANGSGKSTLLKCIFGLLPLWAGDIIFNGTSIKKLKPNQIINTGIVYIPQKNFCFENLTIDENLKIAGSIYSRGIANERIKRLYKDTMLGELKHRRPRNLSGGEKKILSIGMALIHEPTFFLFDEVFIGIDNNFSKEISNILEDIYSRQNIGGIIIEHNISAFNKYSNQINLINGKIIF